MDQMLLETMLRHMDNWLEGRNAIQTLTGLRGRPVLIS